MLEASNTSLALLEHSWHCWVAAGSVMRSSASQCSSLCWQTRIWLTPNWCTGPCETRVLSKEPMWPSLSCKEVNSCKKRSRYTQWPLQPDQKVLCPGRPVTVLYTTQCGAEASTESCKAATAAGPVAHPCISVEGDVQGSASATAHYAASPGDRCRPFPGEHH